MSDRGIHPDLIDEEPPPSAPAESSPPRSGRRSAARAQSPAPSPETPGVTQGEPAEAEGPPSASEASAEPAPPSEPPEWWKQAKDATDPKAAFSLLVKNLSKDELDRDPTLQGWFGHQVERRARALLAQADADKLEQQKREAAARGDLYTLGELSAPEIQQRAQQTNVAQQGAPFMDGVVAFQSKLPQDVQLQIQGKTFGSGRSYAEGVAEYLEAVTQATVSQQLTEAVEREIKRREPALRKAWLSETNGSGPTPEIDGGPAPSSREITDEQIAAMSLEEYNALFDENGRPKAGTRVRLTRGIDTRRQR